jgi:hypothetical protein
VFTFRMVLAGGSPAEPPQFVSSEPRWEVGMNVGMNVRVGAELKYRITRSDFNASARQDGPQARRAREAPGRARDRSRWRARLCQPT